MTDADIAEIATMLHRRFSDAHINLEAVKSEKDDGSPDWKQFHTIRLENANSAFENSVGLRDRFIAENREVLRKAFGL